MSRHYSENDFRAEFPELDRMYLVEGKFLHAFTRDGFSVMFQGEHPDPNWDSSLEKYLLSRGRTFMTHEEAYQHFFPGGKMVG
jgi:hypothetical protein